MQTPEYRREYYKKNKRSILDKNKKWAIENPEAMKELQKRFTQTPKGIYQCLKTNCHNKKRPFALTQKEFLDWYSEQEKRCCYCGVKEHNIPSTFQKVSVSRNGVVKRLTIDRKDNKKGYEVSNIALCCAQCNRMKGEFLSYEEMLEVGKIINKIWKRDCDVDLATVNVNVRRLNNKISREEWNKTKTSPATQSND